jgi:HPt (histidine-containing phosphotransfer) domain-containing protein
MNCKELGHKIGLDEDEYLELVMLFLDTGRADYDRLKTAFEAGDAQQVARSAHTISGAAGNMGIMNVHEVAKRIELAAVEDQLNSVCGDVDTLNELFDEIVELVGV